MSNRIEAYEKIKPKLSGIRLRIFDQVEDKTISELVNLLHIPKNTISGRISELESMGLITSHISTNGESVWTKVSESFVISYSLMFHLRRAREMRKTLEKYEKKIKELEEIPNTYNPFFD